MSLYHFILFYLLIGALGLAFLMNSKLFSEAPVITRMITAFIFVFLWPLLWAAIIIRTIIALIVGTIK